MKARLPKGYGGGPQNMNSMIRQAQKMQEEMDALQEELDARENDIESGGGAVKLKISGTKEILSLEIEPDLVDPEDIETLTDVLIAAFNAAVKKVDDTNSAEQEKITGKLNMPGLG